MSNEQSTDARGPHPKNPTRGLTLPYDDYLIIGDVHGCWHELTQLLDTHGNDRQVVFVGDLVDKGPKPHRVLELAKVMRATVVMGNHEENHVRYAAHEQRKSLTGKKNPMRRPSDFRETHKKVAASPLDLLPWLASFPHFVRIMGVAPGRRDLVVLHGGLLPDVTPEEMDAKQIVRVRNVKPNGKMATLDDVDKDPTLPFWTDLYGGPDWIAFGHAPFLNAPIKNRTIGLDTGCVYGNRLTALLMPEMQLVHVAAHKSYRKKSKW